MSKKLLRIAITLAVMASAVLSSSASYYLIK